MVKLIKIHSLKIGIIFGIFSFIIGIFASLIGPMLFGHISLSIDNISLGIDNIGLYIPWYLKMFFGPTIFLVPFLFAILGFISGIICIEIINLILKLTKGIDLDMVKSNNQYRNINKK